MSVNVVFKLLVGMLLLFAVATARSPASAGEFMPFDAKGFEAAQSAGKTIVVHVHADWCPTCRKQGPILDKLTRDKAFSQAVFFRVDFDNDRRALQMFKVDHQATVIVFKGRTETARATWETDPDKIRALLKRGL